VSDGAAPSADAAASAPTSVEVPITNRRGLHARASAKFVTIASSYGDTVVEVEKDGATVVGTSIMGLMMLGAGIGDSIRISANGPQADAAVAALRELVEAKFGED
jgi:phosphocarrier protein HPr